MERQHGSHNERERDSQECQGRNEQMPDVTSTDPGTASLPPAEGRTDIGTPHKTLKGRVEEYVSGATTAPRATNAHHLSKEPAEGRADIDTEQTTDKNMNKRAEKGGKS